VRLAFVSTILAYPWGGADKLWTRAAEAALGRADATLVAVSSRVAEHDRIRALGDRGATIVVRSGPTLFKGRRAALTARAEVLVGRRVDLIAALRRFEPDHVLVCQGGTYDFTAEPGLVAWIEEQRVPFSVICQANSDLTSLAPDARATAERIFDKAHCVFFVSRHNLQLAERQLAIPIPRGVVVQNPVELPVRALPRPVDAVPQLAVVSRLDALHKGLDLLIDALARIVDHDWRLNIYGTGPDESYLRRLAQRAGVADRVVFHGHHANITDVWERNHWLLLPSRFEGCALAMLEAIACGRPVLATDVGGAREWVTDGDNGVVIDAATVPLIADGLRRLLDGHARWCEMAEAATRVARRISVSPEADVLSAISGVANPC
jgi:glycosyltransferase involved in cell wall biosynthesis